MNLLVRLIRSRKLQTAAAFPETFAQPDISHADLPAWIEKRAHLRHGWRKAQTVPEFNRWPRLNTGTSEYPGVIQERAHRTRFKRQLQTVPILPRKHLGEDQWPGPVLEKAHKSQFERTHQEVALSPSYPATDTSPGDWPTWKRPETLKSEFEVRLQRLPVLSEHSATPSVGEQAPSAYQTHFEKTRKTRFHHQSEPWSNPDQAGPSPSPDRSFDPKPFVIREIPSRRQLSVTPLPWTSERQGVAAEYPSFVLETAQRTTFDRRIQPDGGLLEHPETGTAETVGLVVSPQGFRVQFKRRLQSVPELNEYPSPPTSEASIAALIGQGGIRRKPRPADILILGVIVSTISQPPAGRPLPAPEVIRRRGWTKLRTPELLSEYTATPAVAEQPPTAYRLPEALRSRFQRRLLIPVGLDRFKPTPQSLEAYRPVIGLKRRHLGRSRAVEALLTFYEPPPTPVEQAVTAFQQPQAFRRHQAPRRRLYALEVGERPLLPDLAVYVRGTITDAVYVATSLGDRDLYISGNVTDVVYVQTGYDTDAHVITTITSATLYLRGHVPHIH